MPAAGAASPTTPTLTANAAPAVSNSFWSTVWWAIAWLASWADLDDVTTNGTRAAVVSQIRTVAAMPTPRVRRSTGAPK
jgi:hypothetical protein